MRITKSKNSKKSQKAFEQLIEKSAQQKFKLCLYVTGPSPQSTKAFANIKDICEEYLEGRYELEVVDVLQRPEMAKLHDVIAAPTLVRLLPEPLRRMIGDLSNKARVLAALNITKKVYEVP